MELATLARARDGLERELEATRGEMQPTQSALLSHTQHIQVGGMNRKLMLHFLRIRIISLSINTSHLCSSECR
jgi:hypothetical protein